MTEITLTHTRLRAGVWYGLLTAPPSVTPEIEVMLLESPVQGVTLAPNGGADGEFLLSVPIPLRMIHDGVHTFVVKNKANTETLGSFAIVAGQALNEDLRAEIDLLRAELDLLKRAFRRHCVETALG
jgi:hypothetical protein